MHCCRPDAVHALQHVGSRWRQCCGCAHTRMHAAMMRRFTLKHSACVHTPSCRAYPAAPMLCAPLQHSAAGGSSVVAACVRTRAHVVPPRRRSMRTCTLEHSARAHAVLSHALLPDAVHALQQASGGRWRRCCGCAHACMHAVMMPKCRMRACAFEHSARARTPTCRKCAAVPMLCATCSRAATVMLRLHTQAHACRDAAQAPHAHLLGAGCCVLEHPACVCMCRPLVACAAAPMLACAAAPAAGRALQRASSKRQ